LRRRESGSLKSKKILRDSWSSTIHNALAWTCINKHEKDTSYTFSSEDELLDHPSGSAESMRQASSCPLCLFSIEENPLSDQIETEDADNERTMTLWAMGLHIANHLYHLMIVSLQIMSAMQAS
jgi:hypothetical protein